MTKFSCTPPIGNNMDNICTDQNNGSEALNLVYKLLAKRYDIKECPRPCKFTKVYFRRNTANPNLSYFAFEFNRVIKKTKAKYAYRELEFLADFGGCVGLFLGISIFDLRKAFRTIVEIIIQRR